MACAHVGVGRDLFRAVRRGGRVRCGGALSGGSAARMVADDGGAAMNEAWRDLGTPKAGGVLLIGDHASAIVPADIDLGIEIGRASCRKECVMTCRSRWSPYQ